MAAFDTRMVVLDPVAPSPSAIGQAAAIIRAGQLVAFPTETVYGLGADGLNATALRRIYNAKGRPSDNPLILHLASLEELPLVASHVPEIAYPLIQAFWPGPLTLVMPKSAGVPDLATGGLATVAVRMPAHPVALALIKAADQPLAAPSANRSGRPSPTTAQHVFDDLHGRIPMILDAGPACVGLESTVLDATCSPPAILRPGGVTREAIEAVIGRTQEATSLEQRRRSPGTRYRHYSPHARVLLLEEAQAGMLRSAVIAALRRNERVGCILHRLEGGGIPSSVMVTRVGGSVEDYAQELFAALRALDKLDLDVIVVEGVQAEGLGAAVMDRLRRAAFPPEPSTGFTES